MINKLLASTVAIVAAVVLALSPDTAFASKRVALVIGNSAYQNVAKLPNPSKDANAVGQMFKKAGFDTVITAHDQGNLEFKRTMRKFEDAAHDAEIVVVFYAGHGIEIGGTNFLIPVDAKLATDRDARDEAIPMDRLIELVEQGSPKKLRLIILDACRDNPFAKTMKRQRYAALRSSGLATGLGAADPTASHTLIAYASKAGSTAEDGEGENSPFTTALLKSLTVPGLDIRLAFGRVRDEVMKLTNQKQEPFVYGSLGGDNISLVPAAVDVVKEIDPAKIKADYDLVAQVGTKRAFEIFIGNYKTGFYVDLAREQLSELTKLAALEPTTAPSARPSSEEQRAWSRLEATNDAAAIQKFIDRYPNSPLAITAKNRLTVLERSAKEREIAAQRAEEERRAKAAADAERQRVQREAEAKRAEDERRLKIAKSEREREELQAKLKREEEDRRAKLADVERRHTELQAQIKRLEDDRRAKQAEAERQKSQDRQQHASLQSPDDKPPAQVSNTPAQIKSAQAELSRIGCFSGAADGAYNDATKIAVRRYLLQQRRPASDIAITDDVVSELGSHKSRVCPLVCQSGYVVSGETCVVEKKAPPTTAKREEPKTKREESKSKKPAQKQEAKQQQRTQPAAKQTASGGRAGGTAILGVGF